MTADVVFREIITNVLACITCTEIPINIIVQKWTMPSTY